MIRTRRKRKTPVKMKRMKKKKPQPLKKRKCLKRKKKAMEVIRLHDQFPINILSLLAITELIIKCYSHSLIICVFSVPTTTIYLCRETSCFSNFSPATLFLDENCIILNYFCYYKSVFLERLSCRKGYFSN